MKVLTFATVLTLQETVQNDVEHFNNVLAIIKDMSVNFELVIRAANLC